MQQWKACSCLSMCVLCLKGLSTLRTNCFIWLWLSLWPRPQYITLLPLTLTYGPGDPTVQTSLDRCVRVQTSCSCVQILYPEGAQTELQIHFAYNINTFFLLPVSLRAVKRPEIWLFHAFFHFLYTDYFHTVLVETSRREKRSCLFSRCLHRLLFEAMFTIYELLIAGALKKTECRIDMLK